MKFKTHFVDYLTTLVILFLGNSLFLYFIILLWPLFYSDDIQENHRVRKSLSLDLARNASQREVSAHGLYTASIQINFKAEVLT